MQHLQTKDWRLRFHEDEVGFSVSSVELFSVCAGLRSYYLEEFGALNSARSYPSAVLGRSSQAGKMVKAWQSVVVVLGVWAVAQSLVSTPAEAQLSPFYYLESCPLLFPIVGKLVYSAIQNETRIAASLLRLHFHDCFVQGCDASVLLDDINATYPSEKIFLPNKNSIRGFEVIDNIKTAVENACPNVVSCADILTIASFYAVILSGGPLWVVTLGRRDSLLPGSNATVLANLPGPNLNITSLKQRFAQQNLSTTDLVSLSGGHTLGLARCAAIYGRLYTQTGVPINDPTYNKTLLSSLESKCPSDSNTGAPGNVTNPLDIQSPTIFDNKYFQNLVQGNGIFTSDDQLYVGASDTKALVELYAASQTLFFLDFALSITSMGNLLPLTGNEGEIRKNCHVPNSVSSSVASEEERRAAPIVEQIEGAEEIFKDMMKGVIEEIFAEKLQRRVEDIVSNGIHSSM